jgi:hypothetical protein
MHWKPKGKFTAAIRSAHQGRLLFFLPGILLRGTWLCDHFCIIEQNERPWSHFLILPDYPNVKCKGTK